MATKEEINIVFGSHLNVRKRIVACESGNFFSHVSGWKIEICFLCF